MVVFVFMLRSFSCVRRKSAEAWSLNGRTIRTGSGLLLSVGEGTGCSEALMAMKRVMVEFKCDLCDAGYVGFTHAHAHAKIQALLKKKNSPKKVTYLSLAPSHTIIDPTYIF